MIGNRRPAAMLKQIVAGRNAGEELPGVTLVLEQFLESDRARADEMDAQRGARPERLTQPELNAIREDPKTADATPGRLPAPAGTPTAPPQTPTPRSKDA